MMDREDEDDAWTELAKVSEIPGAEVYPMRGGPMWEAIESLRIQLEEKTARVAKLEGYERLLNSPCLATGVLDDKPESIAERIKVLDREAASGPWDVRVHMVYAGIGDDAKLEPCLAVDIDDSCCQEDVDLMDEYRELAPKMAAAWYAERARVAKLQELVEEWQAAAGIGVDSDGITPAMAGAHWGKLEARVSEAEQCFELDCPCCGRLAANWIVRDGDDLLCGCDGQISCCSETYPYAQADDCECGGDGYPGREDSKPEAENQPEREEGEPCTNCGSPDCEPGTVD